MRLIDSNVWLALAINRHPLHGTAQTWLVGRNAGDAHFCRATQQSFLRLLTTQAVFAPYQSPPLSNRDAWNVYRRYRVDKRIAWANEPRQLDEQWRKYSDRLTVSPKLWMDAYLAAFAAAGRYRLVTTDVAFKQFKGLELEILGQ